MKLYIPESDKKPDPNTPIPHRKGIEFVTFDEELNILDKKDHFIIKIEDVITEEKISKEVIFKYYYNIILDYSISEISH